MRRDRQKCEEEAAALVSMAGTNANGTNDTNYQMVFLWARIFKPLAEMVLTTKNIRCVGHVHLTVSFSK